MLGMLKVIPMLLAFLAIINMLLDFIGVETSVISVFAGVSVLPLAFLYIASYVFRFCEYHRMFLHYILLNNVVTYFDYYVGIPVSNAGLFVIHLALIGMLLFLVLYFYRRERCCR